MSKTHEVNDDVKNLQLIDGLSFVILTGVKWNVKAVLICITLVARNDGNFLRCF